MERKNIFIRSLGRKILRGIRDIESPMTRDAPICVGTINKRSSKANLVDKKESDPKSLSEKDRGVGDIGIGNQICSSGIDARDNQSIDLA